LSISDPPVFPRIRRSGCGYPSKQRRTRMQRLFPSRRKCRRIRFAYAPDTAAENIRSENRNNCPRRKRRNHRPRRTPI